MRSRKRCKVERAADSVSREVEEEEEAAGQKSHAPSVAVDERIAGSGEESANENIWEGKEDLLLEVLTYLDVPSLVEKKQVCKHWKNTSTKAIDLKCGGTPKAFQANDELKVAVLKYTRSVGHPERAEEIASTYGWPIGKWDVSNVETFFYIFGDCCEAFNEDIGDWDTSSGTNFSHLFHDCAASMVISVVGILQMEQTSLIFSVTV